VSARRHIEPCSATSKRSKTDERIPPSAHLPVHFTDFEYSHERPREFAYKKHKMPKKYSNSPGGGPSHVFLSHLPKPLALRLGGVRRRRHRPQSGPLDCAGPVTTVGHEPSCAVALKSPASSRRPDLSAFRSTSPAITTSRDLVDPNSCHAIDFFARKRSKARTSKPARGGVLSFCLSAGGSGPLGRQRRRAACRAHRAGRG
jgi:hypothetical protein